MSYSANSGSYAYLSENEREYRSDEMEIFFNSPVFRFSSNLITQAGNQIVSSAKSVKKLYCLISNLPSQIKCFMNYDGELVQNMEPARKAIRLQNRADPSSILRRKASSKIDEIYLRNCDSFQDVFVLQLYDNLERLFLEEVGICNWNFLKYMTNLRTFAWSDSNETSFLDLESLGYLTNAETLETVELSSPTLSDEHLKVLNSSAYRCITHLTLRRGKHLTDATLYMISSWIQLKHLTLSELYYITDRGLSHLRSLKNLNDFRLNQISKHVTGETIVKVLDHIGKSLTCLSLARCIQINDEHVFQIIKYIPNIHFFDLDDCPSITGQTLKKFCKKSLFVLHLKELSIRNTNLSQNVIDYFKKKKPDVLLWV